VSRVLTDQEINMLQQALNEGKVDIQKQAKSHHAIETYDFVAKKHLPPKLLTVLTTIFHRFSLNFRASLSLKLRKVVRMDLLQIDNLTFNEFMKGLPSLCWINIVKIDAINSQCLFIIESGLALSLVDFMCGGPGAVIKKNTSSFALLEQSLIKKIVELALKDLSDSFNSIVNTGVYLEGIEFNPQLLTVFSPDESLSIIPIKVTIEQLGSNIVFAIPHNSLKSIKETPTVTSTNYINKDLAEELLNILLDVEVDLVVEFTNLEMTTEQFLSLKEGAFLDINKSLSDKVIVKVEDTPCYSGYPVQIKGNKGVKIINEDEGEIHESEDIERKNKGNS